MCSCLMGVSRWFTPLACGPGSPELSKSYMDMASKLFTFTFTFTNSRRCWCRSRWLLRLRTGSHFSPASLPAPDPVVHVSAWGAVADARLGLA